MFDQPGYPFFTDCMHRHVVVENRGSIRLVNGEVMDDLHDVLVCTECGLILSEREVRAAWLGKDAHYFDPLMEEDDYGDF